jgi:hypothetical protein
VNSDRDVWTEWYEKRLQKPTDPKPNKYGATTVHVDGLRFDSMREAARYKELSLLVAAGEITDLEIHPGFPLMVLELTHDGPPLVLHTIGHYHADFKYRNERTNSTIVEDVKSKPTTTEAYRLRKKFIEAQHQITIVEIT